MGGFKALGRAIPMRTIVRQLTGRRLWAILRMRQVWDGIAQYSRWPITTGSKVTQITALRVLMESALLQRYSIGPAMSGETVVALQERRIQDRNKLRLLLPSVIVRTMLRITGQVPAAIRKLNHNSRNNHDPLLSSSEINTLNHHDRSVAKQCSNPIQCQALKPHLHLRYRPLKVRQIKLK